MLPVVAMLMPESPLKPGMTRDELAAALGVGTSNSHVKASAGLVTRFKLCRPEVAIATHRQSTLAEGARDQAALWLPGARWRGAKARSFPRRSATRREG